MSWVFSNVGAKEGLIFKEEIDVLRPESVAAFFSEHNDKGAV